MKFKVFLLLTVFVCVLFGCKNLDINGEVIAKSVKMTPVIKTFAQGENENAFSCVGFNCEFTFEAYNLGLGTNSTEQTLCIWLEEPMNKHVKEKGIHYEKGATYSDLPMRMNDSSTHNVFCIIDDLNVNGWTLEEAENLLSEMDELYITIQANGKTISTQYVEIIK